MHEYTLSHLADEVLLRDLAAIVARDRATTAILLAHIAEVDARKLYVPAGYPSMHAYCVEELRLSEDAAYKRIQAARAGRLFPALFSAVSDGRLHVTAVWLLAPHLTQGNVEELIDTATHRKRSEIEEELARRFPAREIPTRASVRPLIQRNVRAESHPMNPELVLGPVGNDPLVPETVVEQRVESLPPQLERFRLQLIIGKSTLEKLRQAQAMLSHAVPSGDEVQILDRALDALILTLEKQKCGATAVRMLRRRPSIRKRHIPADVRRAVWARDGRQCTFVGKNGKRCGSRRFLEFDHIEPVARGGKATVNGIRLRCRAHNQFEAERVFGIEFMRQKKVGARPGVVEARALSALQANARVAREQARSSPGGDPREWSMGPVRDPA